MNIFTKLFSGFTKKSKMYSSNRKKVKIKSSQSLLKRLFNINDDVMTAVTIILLILFLFFLYLIWGQWSVAKWTGGIEQYDEIKLPGKAIK